MMMVALLVVRPVLLPPARRRPVPQRRLPGRRGHHQLSRRLARDGRDRDQPQDRGSGQRHRRHQDADLALARRPVDRHRRVRACRAVRQSPCRTCARRSSRSASSLPPEVKEPLIQRFNPDDQPIVSIAVRSDIRSVRELTTLADQVIVKRLQTVRDVGRVTIVGGVKRADQHRARSRPHACAARRRQRHHARRSATRTRTSRPATSSAATTTAWSRSPAASPSPGSFADLIVARRGARPGLPAPGRHRGRRPAGAGEHRRRSTASARARHRRRQDAGRQHHRRWRSGVRRAVDELQKTLPPDVKLEIVRDSSRGIQNSVDNVQQTMIEGGLLTIAIVFLFLHSWRSTVITGLTLPISVFGAFMVMEAFGFTLNVLTLMALSLAIGLLIDDAIVVRENIVRHIGIGKIAPPGRARRHRRDRPGGAGHHLLHRRGVPAGRLHGRHHRPLLLPVRHHGRGRGAGLAVRVLHARPDAVVGLARPAGPRHRPLRPHRQRRPGARQPRLSRHPGLGAALAQDSRS